MPPKLPFTQFTLHIIHFQEIRGKIEFKNVHFSYPTRPDVKVLKGLKFTLNAGKTLALVGESGCGKSTVISLVERFYDPTSGGIVSTTEPNLYTTKSYT